MPSYVTRVVVTQTDNYQPPAHDITAVAGYTVWMVEWTLVRNGRETELGNALYSKDSARLLTQNLLEMRPPDKSVEDVLTLIGFDER